jgi:hypothetical protein
MINVTKMHCEHPDGCGTKPSFNFPGETKGVRCCEHQLKGMRNVVGSGCAFPDCPRVNPGYNTPGSKRGIWCFEHKEEGMVDVTAKLCAFPSCPNLQPQFNFPGEGCGLMCLEHKEQGMFDVYAKLCDFPTCMTVASFGLIGAGAVRCKVHCTPAMVVTTKHTCSYEGCGVRHPQFNVKGSKRGERCLKHKTACMFNVMAPLCTHPGCEERATLAEPGDRGAVRCKEHRSPTMVSVKRKTCQAPSCRELATYGKDEYHRAQFCVVHSKDTYVCIADALRCSHEGCKRDYEFVVETETGAQKVCPIHAPPGYEEALKRMCKYCDIREDIPFVCATCRTRMHKKEYAVGCLWCTPYT